MGKDTPSSDTPKWKRKKGPILGWMTIHKRRSPMTGIGHFAFLRCLPSWSFGVATPSGLKASQDNHFGPPFLLQIQTSQVTSCKYLGWWVHVGLGMTVQSRELSFTILLGIRLKRYPRSLMATTCLNPWRSTKMFLRRHHFLPTFGNSTESSWWHGDMGRALSYSQSWSIFNCFHGYIGYTALQLGPSYRLFKPLCETLKSFESQPFGDLVSQQRRYCRCCISWDSLVANRVLFQYFNDL